MEWINRARAWFNLLLGREPRQTRGIRGIGRLPYKSLGWGWLLQVRYGPTFPLIKFVYRDEGDMKMFTVVSRLPSRPYTSREREGLSRLYERVNADA